MLPRFSHHKSPVLNHTDPINSRHWLRCTTDATPFAITAGWEASCCDQSEFSLQSGTLQAQTTEPFQSPLYESGTVFRSISHLLCHFLSSRRSTLGDRAFPVASARAWNSLPSSVRNEPSLTTFRHKLKTVLFRSSFDND